MNTGIYEQESKRASEHHDEQFAERRLWTAVLLRAMEDWRSGNMRRQREAAPLAHAGSEFAAASGELVATKTFGKSSLPRIASAVLRFSVVLLLTGAIGRAQLGAVRDSQSSQEAAPAPYCGVRIEKAWIPMKDGVRLAVNLFMPEGAKPAEKFPATLEYLPYRKDDWAAQRDYGLYSYFAPRGYVGARVDIRGTGASEGLPPDRELFRAVWRLDARFPLP